MKWLDDFGRSSAVVWEPLFPLANIRGEGTCFLRRFFTTQGPQFLLGINQRVFDIRGAVGSPLADPVQDG